MSLKRYCIESVHELHNVTWPTRRQAVRITVVVLLFMAVSAVVLGLVDQFLAVLYRWFLTF